MGATHGNEHSVFGNTLVLKPLAEAADGNAGSLTHSRVLVAETGFYQRPDLAHERGHVFAAAFNCDTEGKNCTTAACGVGRVEVLADQLAERREDLRWGKVGGKTINDAKRRLEQQN